MKKLYVGCALKLAPPEFVTSVLELKDVLRRCFHVLDFHGFRESNHNIYKFDMAQVDRSEAMLAICDFPSFGLGVEVARTLNREVPVVAVAHHNSVVSGFATDMPEIERLFSFHRYNSLEEIPGLLKRTLL